MCDDTQNHPARDASPPVPEPEPKPQEQLPATVTTEPDKPLTPGAVPAVGGASLGSDMNHAKTMAILNAIMGAIQQKYALGTGGPQSISQNYTYLIDRLRVLVDDRRITYQLVDE